MCPWRGRSKGVGEGPKGGKEERIGEGRGGEGRGGEGWRGRNEGVGGGEGRESE